MSSYLQSLNFEKLADDRPIVLDLGSEMTSVEMGLFTRLAKNCDIVVIVPNPKWKERFHFLLNTYKTNAGFAHQKTLEASPLNVSKKLPEQKDFLRLSTQLAEVKWITQTVRQWLDEGVEPRQIALLSPQVEKYWPSLATHLEVEGIPVDKSIVTSLISTGLFQSLISNLQSYSSALSWESLEVSYFGGDADITQDTQDVKEFEKFKALFIELTDIEDLGRDQLIKKIYYRKIDFNSILDRTEFLIKVIDVISKQFVKPTQTSTQTKEFFKTLEITIKEFLAQTQNCKFKFSDWFEVLKSILSRKEIKIKNGQSEGLQIRDVGAVYLGQITHRIWFGLDDSSFQSTSKNLIPIKDIEALKTTFDFPIQYPEESHDDFNLRWLSQSSCDVQYFTCAKVNISGEPLNTALFILENNTEPDYFFEPRTRLDQLQKNFTTEEKNKIYTEKYDFNNKVDVFRPVTLSSTDVINYAQCEFKLLASKGFRLRDESVVSVDLDPMQKGTLAHSLFEFLITENRYTSATDEMISNFLDQARFKLKLFPNDDLFWSIQKSKFIQIGVRFSKNEKLRLQGQSLQHIVEKEFVLNIDEFQIKGRIDRIDHDLTSNEYLIYDYKRSDSQKIYHIDKWLAQKQFQMLFYMLALGEQLGQLDHIKGAVYYFYQKLKINKGALISGQNQFESAVEVKKNMKVESADFIQIMTEFKIVLTELFSKIKESDFNAVPIEPNICDFCEWRRLCRAHHLN
jgi:ATP-dependent helicase/DNAse subunit B